MPSRCVISSAWRSTGEQRHLQLALQLVDRTHHTLGRHRNDDPRDGWISGLDAREGESYPTRGGLRIGKGLPEHDPDEAFDERLEWERDGQYFHPTTLLIYNRTLPAGVFADVTGRPDDSGFESR
jgi:hypothetical protein